MSNTLETIANYVGLFVSEPMQPEIFCTHYDSATKKLLMQHIVSGNWDNIRNFRRVKGDGDMSYALTDGWAALPDDFLAFETAYYKQGTTPRLIRVVDDETFDTLLQHRIEYPTAQYPVGNIIGSRMRVRPPQIKYITMAYIAKPEPVVYAVDSSQGYAAFDEANSSQVLWTDVDIPVIVSLILEQMGVKVEAEKVKDKMVQA